MALYSNRSAYGSRVGDKKSRVAALMEQDLTPPEIAERLGISRKSVSARITEIRHELGWQAQ